MSDYMADPSPAKVKDNDTFYQAKLNMVRAHFKYLLFHLFRKFSEEEKFTDPRNSQILKLVLRVYSLHELLE